ncbi:hypothetical protein [Microbulbifer sp. S227A]|uniref:hypothetical protein n=1 Tax=Microbulbifer sp. S227A TaxID=3415131 RepID=UPI003C7E84A6
MTNLFRLAPVLCVVAACEMPDNATSGAHGVADIALVDGRNCWANRCFDYDGTRQTVVLPGKNPARVPGGIDTQKGYVTAPEFTAMFNAAAMSYANGVGRR